MDIVLFGNGKFARDIISESNERIIAIIDNYKSGTSEYGIPYITIGEYKSNYSKIAICISSMKYSKEMIDQLRDNEIYNYYIPSMIYKHDDVPHDNDIGHDNWKNYLKEVFDHPGIDILEVGSRRVVGDVKKYFTRANYIGFDIYPGENVDVVGDAHRLGQYFDKRFDLIFSSAVFEHLAMPWIVSAEIIKLLKPGGCVFVETHYSYSSHERPWHFFQFSENALSILFPRVFGIECIKKGCSNLIEGKFSDESSNYLKGNIVDGLYCHSEFLGKKVFEVNNYDWSKVDLDELVEGTEYPRA